MSRQNEIDYLLKSGVNISWDKAKYSINKGLWGTSVGGDETLTSNLKLPEEAYPGKLTESEKKDIVLTFKKGEIVGLNGEFYDPVTCIELINKECDKFCIGRDIHVGDSIIGIKGRVGFQAGKFDDN